jgi:peptidyl-prolyl cis-trans isomerase D
VLEAIRERAQGWIAKVILVLIAVPFAFWGVDSYFNGNSQGDVVATVGDIRISNQEYTQVLREQADRMRNALGGAFDPGLIETQDFRSRVLDALIEQKVLLGEAEKAGMAVPDSEVAAVLGQIPAFQENGTFSKERYEGLLKSRGLTPTGFENDLRQALLLEALQSGYTAGTLIPATSLKQLAALVTEQRESSWIDFSPAAYRAQVNLTPAAVRAVYDGDTRRFVIPEAVKLEYLVLSPETLAPGLLISEAQIEDFYKSQQATLGSPELRRASHILVAVPAGADAAKKMAARNKAEKMLAEIRQQPARFEVLARTQSDDPGAAAQAGSLGDFPRGAMVKPFEDAVFSMKPGEIRGPVETDFGFHIIRLDGITPSSAPPLAQVRDKIVAQLRADEAKKRFAQSAEAFSDAVYETPESFAKAAQTFGLKVQVTDWVTRTAGGAPFDQEKLRQAVFAPDSLKLKQNSEAIDIGRDTLVSARVVSYRAAQRETFEKVKPLIETELLASQSRELAKKAGEAALKLAEAGKEPGKAWTELTILSRQQPAGFGAQSLREVFRMATGTLPAYRGVALPDGTYRLVRVTRVLSNPAAEAAAGPALQATLQRALGQSDETAAIQLAKSSLKIEIKPEPKQP